MTSADLPTDSAIGNQEEPQGLGARRTLERAWFFLRQAENRLETNRHECQHFVEAAIVFARSVTLHLQKELRTESWFEEWYGGVREELNRNEIARYMLTSRNIILKEGPIPVRRHISVSIADALAVSATVTGGVLSGPRHKRTLHTIFRDAIRKGKSRLRGLQRKLWRRTRPIRGGPTPTTVSYRLYFDDSVGQERSAFDVLEEYLETLEVVVQAAEDEAERLRETA